MSKSNLFDRYLKGDQAALEDLMSSERELLIDYFDRMTDAELEPLKGVEEAIQAVLGEINHYKSYDELRLSLYSTVRRFNREHWKLGSNNSCADDLMPLGGIKENSPVGRVELMEKLLASLSSPEQEVLILTHKLDFDLEDASRIMGISSGLGGSYLDGCHKKAQQCLPNDRSLNDLFSQTISSENMEPTSSTIAVSQVIKNVQRGIPIKGLPWYLLALILLGLIWFLINNMSVSPG